MSSRRQQKGQRVDGTHLQPSHGVPATGLRFFTVYGPRGVPIWPRCCLRAILAVTGVFNHGKMQRISPTSTTSLKGCCVAAISLLHQCRSIAPRPCDGITARVFNIGNSHPTELLRFIEVMEQALGQKAIKDSSRCSPVTLWRLLLIPKRLRIGLVSTPSTS